MRVNAPSDQTHRNHNGRIFHSYMSRQTDMPFLYQQGIYWIAYGWQWIILSKFNEVKVSTQNIKTVQKTNNYATSLIEPWYFAGGTGIDMLGIYVHKKPTKSQDTVHCWVQLSRRRNKVGRWMEVVVGMGMGRGDALVWFICFMHIISTCVLLMIILITRGVYIMFCIYQITST